MRTVNARKKEAFSVYSFARKFRAFLAGIGMRSSKMKLKYHECLPPV